MRVFTLSIDVTGAWQVKSESVTKVIVTFGGTCAGECFSGTILPGGVDTQTISPAGFALSARYMIDGTTAAGTPARIFIENNSYPGEEGTHPAIVTDCEELRWLQTTPLRGSIHDADGKLTILIDTDEQET